MAFFPVSSFNGVTARLRFELLCETNILSRADGRVPARRRMTQCCARGEKGEHQVSAIIKSPAGPWARLANVERYMHKYGTNWNVSLKVSLERPVSVHLGHLPAKFHRLNELCHPLMSEWR